MNVKKLRYFAFALIAVAFCACQKEPSTSDLHRDYLVYTAHDTGTDFAAIDTYYIPDSILIIGNSDKTEYWKDADAMAIIGIGQGIVVRQQATTGGTDIVGMLLQKFAGIKFSTGILLADGFVVLSGLAVIGFGIGTGEAAANGWMLTLYSLITIYISSRVIAYLLDGASYDKLLFIISDHHEELKRFIIDDLDRSATYIKSKGMYTDSLRDMIFLVVSRKEVRLVQHKIKEIDPKAFVVVTDAYETFGEGFKQFPEKNEIQAE